VPWNRVNTDSTSTRRRWWRPRPVHAVVASVAIGVMLASGLTATGASLSALSNCSDVTFIAAIGSGEKYYGPTDITDASAELANVYRAFVARLGTRRSYQPLVIDYPALPVGVLFAGSNFAAKVINILTTNIPTYLNGKNDGVRALWSAFETTRASCPNERIVLAGYSQGAMVVHQFLEELNATRDSASKAAVRGVILLADPDRVKHSSIVDFGNAPFSGYGACDVVSHFVSCTAPDPLTDIPGRFQSVTIGVCTYEDPVCDTSDFIPDWLFNTSAGRKQLVARVERIHSSYSYTIEPRLAGQRIAQLVLAR